MAINLADLREIAKGEGRLPVYSRELLALIDVAVAAYNLASDEQLRERLAATQEGRNLARALNRFAFQAEARKL